MKRLIYCLFLMGLSAVLFPGCGGEETATVSNKDELAARVEDWTLEKQIVYDFIAQLPEAQKRKFDTPPGRAEITERFIVDELFYREALRTGLSERDDVKKLIDDAQRRILMQAYYNKNVAQAARPTEEEIHDYYESHADAYTSLVIMRAQHIFSKSREKLLDLKERIIDGGESFTTMAHMYSEDEVTKGDGGNLGYFNPGGYIRGIGYSPKFDEALSGVNIGEVNGPVEWERGFSLVVVNERRPAQLKPYDEVKDEIIQLLSNDKIDQVKNAKVAEIRKDYSINNYFEEYYRSIQRSPDELWTYAQTSDDPYTRIKTFEEIVEKFPDDPHAPQALFMVGFVYLEELADKVTADRTFARVLDRYPDSDVADSARWMLENMDKPLPKFEDIDDLNRQIKDKSN